MLRNAARARRRAKRWRQRAVPPGGQVSDPEHGGCLFARPSGDSTPLAIDSNRFYASYYRLVFGFESQKGNLAWVRTHAHDLRGYAAARRACRGSCWRGTPRASWIQ